MPDVPAEVAERIRRPAPTGHAVVEGSLPVVSFGDYRAAEVATLALNPSSLEFLDQQGAYLLEDVRRLASRVSMQRLDPVELSGSDVAGVFSDSNTYFRRKPLWSWFHWLETLMGGADLGSYLGGTACHLDLVQWATKPAQGKLAADVWQRLVDEDRKFLTWQLGQTPARTVLVNGASCVGWLEKEKIVRWDPPEILEFSNAQGRPAHLKVWKARRDDQTYLGWNKPLAQPIAADGRARLDDWVAASARR
jgi:hypothetical protein